MVTNKKSWRFRIWGIIGNVLYWLTWPGIWLVITLTPPRTRIVVIYQDKVLLTKDWLGSGKWNLPGGGLHKNEPAKQGAVRELHEETGIRIKASDLQYLSTINARGSGITSTLVCFWAQLKSQPNIRKQKFEILEYCWMDLNQMNSFNLTKASLMILAALSEDHNLLHYKMTP